MPYKPSWNEILLLLAEQYEGVKPKGHFVAETQEEREMVAELRAEGSIEVDSRYGSYRFTNQGYAKYKPFIDGLRKLGGP